MKTAAFGVTSMAMAIFTILAVLQICTVDVRGVNLEDNLQHALESSLQTAMSEKSYTYTIATDDELVADVMEGITTTMTKLGPEDDLKIDVNEVDKDLGIVSVKATMEYVPIIGAYTKDTNGDGVINSNDEPTKTKVTAERTVILDEYNLPQAGRHTVNFVQVFHTSKKEYVKYKSYSLTDGVNLMAPASPDGGYWYMYDGPESEMTDILNPPKHANYERVSVDDIKAMKLSKDVTFYSRDPSVSM